MSRPRLGRSEPLRLSFTPDELQWMLEESARAGYKQIRDWARDKLLTGRPQG